MKSTSTEQVYRILLICFTVIGICAGRFIPQQSSVVTSPETVVSTNNLTDWQLLEMAIIKTESEFDTLAVGKSKDLGIFQITPIYVQEVNRLLGEEKYLHEEAFSPSKSLEMFNIVQTQYNPGYSIDKAINIHNPGGDSIGYSVRVRKNMDWIKKYEEIRALVKSQK